MCAPHHARCAAVPTGSHAVGCLTGAVPQVFAALPRLAELNQDPPGEWRELITRFYGY